MVAYELSHKNVTSEHASFTKAEREYVRGMVNKFSFQRLTDSEIVQWLHIITQPFEELNEDVNNQTQQDNVRVIRKPV